MSKRIELVVGQVFGRLTVLGEAEPRAGLRYLLCKCSCGKELPRLRKTLVSGLTKSCGCFRSHVSTSMGPLRKTHGVTGTRDYNCWASMVHRCSSSKCRETDALRYRDRGITVDSRWLKFENFFADMGSRPTGMTLERLDVNGPYSLSNCVWASMKTQANNRTSNLVVTFQGKRMTATQAAELVGLSPGTVYARKHRGWAESEWFKPLTHR